MILRWHLQRGIVVFPKSADPQRLAENLGATDFGTCTLLAGADSAC